MSSQRDDPKQGPAPEGVAQFPPLPRLPSPPRLPEDPRQRSAMRILGTIAQLAESGMRVAGPNFASCYYASAPDLGKLQHVLERGLGRYEAEQIEARWDEIFDWVRRTLGAWVQRSKGMRIERHETGIHVHLETQDDLGYYRYEFDVFPKRGRPHHARRATSST